MVILLGVASANNYTFLGLVSSIVDAPITALFGKNDANGNRVGGLFNLTILGTDMSALFGALLSLCVVLLVVKLVLGRK